MKIGNQMIDNIILKYEVPIIMQNQDCGNYITRIKCYIKEITNSTIKRNLGYNFQFNYEYV